ncbi:MAG: glycosyltransferase family 2 protein [Spirochaetes bacterium]|nr:glycosyltransferase family 2 protein [Spirochaetota bacterium]
MAEINPDISLIIPVYNSLTYLPDTYREICAAMQKEAFSFEIIFVDDAGTDASLRFLVQLQQNDARVRIHRHERNKGQQAALAAGFFLSRGNTVITTDADLPVPCAAFGDLVRALRLKNLDFIAGFRQNFRHAGLVRRWGAAFVNFLLRAIYDFRIRDFGCGTNALDRSLIERFRETRIPHSPIKLAVLALAHRYEEMPLPVRAASADSGYTLVRLAALTLDLVLFRFRARRFFRRVRDP